VKHKWMGVLFLALMPAAGLAAGPGDESLQFFGQLDYFLRGDVDDEVVDVYNTSVDAIGNASNDVTTTNGIGGRLGIRKPLAGNRFDLGASIGLLVGPSIEVEFRDFTSPGGNIDEEITSSVARLLLEAGAWFPLGERASFRLGAGLGIAKTSVEDEFHGTGLYVGNQTSKESDTGFTWEVSPALVIPASRADLEIGLRYAAFPKVSASANTFEFDWKALGIYIGAAF
jgi:hypothetical protein